MIEGCEDAVMEGLHESVRQARLVAEKASTLTATVLKNEMRTMAQRHKQARDASFGLLKPATVTLDQAMASAKAEIAAIKTKLRGPEPSRDHTITTRQAELRERLSLLSPDRRKEIIDEAIKTNDQLLLGAILHGYAWECGLSNSEIELLRHSWAGKHHGADVDRLERLSKATEAASRAGAVFISFIDKLTDANLVANAEAMEKQSALALAAVR
jgi:hypothetical protein